MYQKTLRSSVEFAGIGTHTGEYCSVKILPAKKGYGIKFFLASDEDCKKPIIASPKSVSSTLCSTSISNEYGDTIQTVEHLMSALGGLGIFNAKIIVYGREIPILDGSAKMIIDLIKSVGIKKYRTPSDVLLIKKEICIGDDKKYLKVQPYKRLAIDIELSICRDNNFSIDQNLRMNIVPELFESDIAYARTFGFFGDMAKLQSMNLIKGTSLENSIVIGADGAILNDSGLRDENEFVRHKALDLIGDISMVGMPIMGMISGNGVGHTFNNQLMLNVLSDQENYEIISSEVESVEEIKIPQAAKLSQNYI